MEFRVNYHKRKNQEFFKQMLNDSTISFSTIQNYIPIYNRFFSLNETNYNAVNLNHRFYIAGIRESSSNNDNKHTCIIKSRTDTELVMEKPVFFKLAPLIDPFKFLIGKYDMNDEKIFTLPSFTSKETDVHPKSLNENNSAYIDGFFSFLSSSLLQNYGFVHGVDYYGSFLGIKNKFKLNVADDLDYLCKSDFFNKNKNVLFEVEEYDHLLNHPDLDASTTSMKNLPPLTILNSDSIKSKNLSISSIRDDLYEGLFVDGNGNEEDTEQSSNALEPLDITSNMDVEETNNSNVRLSLKSSSTCSSRSSHTSLGDEEGELDDDDDNNVNDDEDGDEDSCDENGDDEGEDEEEDDDEEYSEPSEPETVYATFPKFPVQVICMEQCVDTFDNLILNNDLSQEEWLSALMQIIMTLITYQKAFSLTHNDLHTNNVMYVETKQKFLYYCYNKTYYKVPTFGRIFKIIDFGRGIYKYNGSTFCSDSFEKGGDASGQYNSEPFFNEKKPRLEPNFSFDLCRLACSIFDFLVDDLDDIVNLEKCKPVVRIIVEWCLDDNGVNILYKNNGDERYEDFKLYKMIARCVHNHRPEAQLKRKEFSAFKMSKKDVAKQDMPRLVNIDEIPSFIGTF